MLGLKRANSHEFDDEDARPRNPHDGQQKDIAHKGGTMRLGAYPCAVRPGSLAADALSAQSSPNVIAIATK